MIDSIKLILPAQCFKILKPQNFNPNANTVYQNASIKAVQNLAKKDLYFPRLTLSRRMNLQGVSEIMLTIEFSIPKLLFGNNVEELQLKDFDQILQILHGRLLSMDVLVEHVNLAQAAVTTVHFAKNIVLTDGSTPFHYIQKIKKLCAPTRLDHHQTNYRNSGHCFKWHANNHEIVFYDKIYDLQQSQISKKRSIDHSNMINIATFNKLRTGRKKFEILRIEVRCNKRSKIKQIFSKLKINNDLTFQKIFKPLISKKVLLYYVDLIEQKRSKIFDFKASSDQALLSTLIVYNPSIKPKDILACIGYKKLLETMTADEIKRLLHKQHTRNWERIMSIFNNFVAPTTHNSFEIIRQQIERYKPIKISNKNI